MNFSAEEKEGSIWIIKVKYSLMGHPETTELDSILSDIISNGCTGVVIDLQDCPWINSSGFHALITQKKRFNENGKSFLLACLRDNASRSDDRTEIIASFEPIYDCTDDAIAGFTKTLETS